jgi:hypothetical protein
LRLAFLQSLFFPYPPYCVFSRDMIFSNILVGGEEMDALVGLGVFLACLGAFFVGIGVLWGVSVWSKTKETKEKK